MSEEKKRGRPKRNPSDEGESRSSNWTCVVYPESLPEDWIQIIDEYHIEWAVSPLHQFDLNATGEDKKPHFHIMLKFGSLKAFDQVKVITDAIHGPIPKRIMNMRAMVRYLCHLDNPEKHQYPVEEIKSYGGFDIADLLRPGTSERYTIIKDMIQHVKKQGITEMQDLVDFAIENQFEEWFRALCDSSERIVDSYIRSQRHRGPKPTFLDSDSGEIV